MEQPQRVAANACSVRGGVKGAAHSLTRCGGGGRDGGGAAGPCGVVLGRVRLAQALQLRGTGSQTTHALSRQSAH